MRPNLCWPMSTHAIQVDSVFSMPHSRLFCISHSNAEIIPSCLLDPFLFPFQAILTKYHKVYLHRIMFIIIIIYIISSKDLLAKSPSEKEKKLHFDEHIWIASNAFQLCFWIPEPVNVTKEGYLSNKPWNFNFVQSKSQWQFLLKESDLSANLEYLRRISHGEQIQALIFYFSFL